jgi:epoxyqueuosine reductase
VWALGQLMPREEFEAMKAGALGKESDESVREEWQTAA